MAEGGVGLGVSRKTNQPVQVSIVDKKNGKSKQEQINSTLSKWMGSGGGGEGGGEGSGGGEELQGAPGLVGRLGVEGETNTAVGESKTRVGDSASRRARDVQNLKSRGLEWALDSAYPTCFNCSSTFSVMNRRHHCRLCGRIFCKECCPPNKNNFPAIVNHNYPVRACCLCYNMDTVDAHTDQLLCITSLSTGEILSTSADNSIRIWEVVWEIDDSSGGQCLATLCGHTGAVTGACELSKGKFVSVSSDKMMKVWEMEDDIRKGGVVVTCLGSLRFSDPLTCVTTLEGKIVCGTEGGSILLCRMAIHEEGAIEVVTSLKGHSAPILSLSSHEDGYLLSGSADGTTKFWDMDSESCLATMEGHTGGVTCIAVIPGTNGCFVTGSEDNSLRIWKVVINHNASGPTGTPKFLATLNGHTDEVTDVKIAKKQYIVSSSKDKSLIMWSLETGKVVAKFLGHSGGVNSVDATPDGLVISGSSDKSMRVWKYTPPPPKDEEVAEVGGEDKKRC